MGFPRERRFQLHSGVSTATKAVLGGCLIGSVLILTPIVALIVGSLVSLADRGAGWVAGALVFALLAVPVVLRLLWLLRSAAWLEGTTLAVRGPLATRRCDLATAVRFHFDTIAESTSIPTSGGVIVAATGRRIPRLIVFDARTGRRVRLRLVDPATRQWLTPPKLHTLANAVLAGRGPDGSSAWQTAATLRAMADDPAGPLR